MIKLLNLLLFLFLLFLSSFQLFSQEEKKVLKIFIYKDNIAMTKFGIANITTKTEGSYKNDFHTITASEGDQLFIASEAFKNFYKIVATEDIMNGKIKNNMRKNRIKNNEEDADKIEKNR